MNKAPPVSVYTSCADPCLPGNASGFTLLEFIVSAVILLVISTLIFSTINEVQHVAGIQADMKTVLDNSRMAMQALERCIRQAGNDPYRKGFESISIISPSELCIRADLTGSAGVGNPNKGDPDGDINDSGENLTIRYNDKRQRIEMISGNGPAQIVADNISGFFLQYFDADGNETKTGRKVRKITATISGTAPHNNPRTGKQYGVRLDSTLRVLSINSQ